MWIALFAPAPEHHPYDAPEVVILAELARIERGVRRVDRRYRRLVAAVEADPPGADGPSESLADRVVATLEVMMAVGAAAERLERHVCTDNAADRAPAQVPIDETLAVTGRLASEPWRLIHDLQDRDVAPPYPPLDLGPLDTVVAEVRGALADARTNPGGEVWTKRCVGLDGRPVTPSEMPLPEREAALRAHTDPVVEERARRCGLVDLEFVNIVVSGSRSLGAGYRARRADGIDDAWLVQTVEFHLVDAGVDLPPPPEPCPLR